MIIGPKIIQQPPQENWSIQEGPITTRSYVCDYSTAAGMYLYVRYFANRVTYDDKGGYVVVTGTTAQDQNGMVPDGPPQLTLSGNEIHRSIWFHPDYQKVPLPARKYFQNANKKGDSWSTIISGLDAILTANSATVWSTTFKGYNAAFTNYVNNETLSILLLNLILSGVDSFKTKSYTIRRSQFLSRLTSTTVSLARDNYIYSTTALAEELGDTLVLSVPFDIPTEYNGVQGTDELLLAYGWFKNPSEVQLLGNRMYSVSESWTAAWATTLLYKKGLDFVGGNFVVIDF